MGTRSVGTPPVRPLAFCRWSGCGDCPAWGPTTGLCLRRRTTMLVGRHRRFPLDELLNLVTVALFPGHFTHTQRPGGQLVPTR